MVLHRLLSIASLALATVCALEANRLWTGWAGSGVMPALVAALFGALAIGFALVPAPHSISSDPLDLGDPRASLVVAAAFAVHLAVVSLVGYLLSTWAFLFVTTRFASHASNRAAAVWSAILALGSYFLFKVALGTPLPIGRFGL